MWIQKGRCSVITAYNQMLKPLKQGASEKQKALRLSVTSTVLPAWPHRGAANSNIWILITFSCSKDDTGQNTHFQFNIHSSEEQLYRGVVLTRDRKNDQEAQEFRWSLPRKLLTSAYLQRDESNMRDLDCFWERSALISSKGILSIQSPLLLF